MSRSKTEYLHCQFSADGGNLADEVAVRGVAIPKVARFRYLGLIVQEDGEIDDDVNQRIKIGWQKWKTASGVLCDKRISLRVKGRVYRMVVISALLYSAEYWPIKNSHLQELIRSIMK